METLSLVITFLAMIGVPLFLIYAVKRSISEAAKPAPLDQLDEFQD